VAYPPSIEDEEGQEDEEDPDYDQQDYDRYTPSPVMDESEFYDAPAYAVGEGQEGSCDGTPQGQVPLIPTGFSSIDEAQSNFTTVFQSR
jgi:hypothetical protein